MCLFRIRRYVPSLLLRENFINLLVSLLVRECVGTQEILRDWKARKGKLNKTSRSIKGHGHEYDTTLCRILSS